MARFSVGEEELTSSRKRKRDTEHGDEESQEEEGGDERVDLESMADNGDSINSIRSSGSGSVAVRIELDVLDCAICFDPLTPPIFQCRNGHVACSTCSSKLGNKCHSCSETIGYARCLVLEKVIESIKIPCSNAEYGCKQTYSYPQKHTHEETCIHAPCVCPVRDCSFRGSTTMLSTHFSRDHGHAAKSFCYNRPFKVSFEKIESIIVLHAEDGHLFILFNRDDEPYGRALSVACIRSGTQGWGWDFYYELTASNKGNTLQVKASTPNIQKTTATYRGNVFLMVPVDFFSCRTIFVDVCIRKAQNSVVN